LLRIG
ncbi:hypothetical protein N499_1047B, partial [Wolbachia pipientis wVitA]